MGGDDKALRQLDFSNLRVQDMTPQQRAELRLRYAAFVRHFDDTPPVRAKPKAVGKRISRWAPGANG
ncbi:MAG TPA: hypothetical protein VN681_11150 [Stellaceae bacterium]|nr:hypothetical protein [Stellaceae bacterium]